MTRLLRPAGVGRLIPGVGLWLSLAGAAFAQLPNARLDGVFPAGGAVGKTADVTLSGVDLDDADKLVFSHPGLTAKQKMADPGPFDTAPLPVENQFIVTIAADVPPGAYFVRSQGKYGLSNPRTFQVDALEERLEKEPNNEPAQATGLNGALAVKQALAAAAATAPAPAAGAPPAPPPPAAPPVTSFPVGFVNGQLNGGADIDWFSFEGVAGQRLILEGFARRLDSRADLVLAVTTPDGTVLAENRRGHDGDPLIDLTLPSAGPFLIRVQDALYGGGGDFSYRLLLSARPHVDFVFPPAGVPGSNDEYTLYGRLLPGGQPSPVTLDGRPLEQLKVRIPVPGDIADKLLYSERLDAHQAGLDGFEYRVPSPAGRSNPVLMTVASAPVVLEQPDNNAMATAQKLTVPSEVAGQFFPQRDRDWFHIDVKAGEVFSIDVISNRLGPPTDAALLVQHVTKNAEGVEIMTQVALVDDVGLRDGGQEFDQRSTDPWYRYTAPSDGVCRLMLRDAYSASRTDPRLVYRLAVRRDQPDFRLAAAPLDLPGAVLLRKGAREAIRVVAFRQDGFEGEITLTAADLPPGVTASEVIVGPAVSFATLILSADAAAPTGLGSLRITGKATIQGREVVRTARVGHPLLPFNFNSPNGNPQSVPARVTDRLPVTVSDEKVVLAVTLSDGKLIETARGGVVKFPITVVRAEGTAGSMTCFPVGLPPTIGVPQVGLGGNNAGELELRLPGTASPGTYSFYVGGSTQGLLYKRNPEAAERAKLRQEAMAKTLTEVTEKNRLAVEAAQKATTELNTSNTELTAATNAKAAADKAAADAVTAMKTATDALAAAKTALAAKPDDAGLKQAVETAQKAFDTATATSKTMDEAAVVALKKFDEATAKQKTAQEAKTKADMDAQAALQLLQQAQQYKQQLDQRAGQRAQEAAQRGFNANIPSTPVTIRIAEFPIKLSGPPEAATVKQGAKLDIPVKIERLFGFTEAVSVQLQPPGGVGGIQLPQLNVAAGQTDGTLSITANPDATVGQHAFTFRAQMTFNGQGLTMDRPLKLTIEKVTP